MSRGIRVSNEGYFLRDELSNSGMGYMIQKLSGESGYTPPQSVFLFGSVVDSILTGSPMPDELEDAHPEVRDAFLLTANECAESWMSDKTNKMVHDTFDKQVAFVNELEISYEGVEFTVKGRCLCDFYREIENIIIDLKTTSATTQKEWLKSIQTYHYDRASAWYMDIVGCDTFVLRAVGKAYPYPLFNTVINRGSPLYLKGLEEYTHLCYCGYMASIGEPMYQELLG